MGKNSFEYYLNTLSNNKQKNIFFFLQINIVKQQKCYENEKQNQILE